jgi:hypothetical protein
METWWSLTFDDFNLLPTILELPVSALITIVVMNLFGISVQVVDFPIKPWARVMEQVHYGMQELAVIIDKTVGSASKLTNTSLEGIVGVFTT